MERFLRPLRAYRWRALEEGKGRSPMPALFRLLHSCARAFDKNPSVIRHARHFTRVSRVRHNAAGMESVSGLERLFSEGFEGGSFDGKVVAKLGWWVGDRHGSSFPLLIDVSVCVLPVSVLLSPVLVQGALSVCRASRRHGWALSSTSSRVTVMSG